MLEVHNDRERAPDVLAGWRVHLRCRFPVVLRTHQTDQEGLLLQPPLNRTLFTCGIDSIPGLIG